MSKSQRDDRIARDSSANGQQAVEHLELAGAHLAGAAAKMAEGVQVANVAAVQAIRDGLAESKPELRAAREEARRAGSSAARAAESGMASLAERSRQLAERSGDFVRERPLAAFGIALAGGFVLSRLLRR